MKKKKIYLMLFLICILGAVPRFYHLDSENLWIDECLSIEAAEQPTLGDLIQITRDSNANPPFYVLFLRGWIGIFGDSDFSTRFPSALLGVISIILIFLVGKEIFDERVGLISSLIMAMSMVHVLYSQETRMYSLLTVATLFSILYYARFLKNPSIKNMVGYIIPTVIFLYTHYFSIFTLLIQNLIFLLIRPKSEIKRWITAQGIILFFSLPILWFLENQYMIVQTAIFGQFMNKYPSLSFLSDIGVLLFLVPMIAGLILFIILRLSNIRVDKLFAKIWSQNLIILLLGSIYLISLFFLPRMTSSFFLTRYTHFTYPIFYILFAKGYTILKKEQKAIIAGLFIVLSMFLLINYHTDLPRKEEWKKASEFLEENYKDGDFVIMLNRESKLCLEHYHEREFDGIGVTPHIDPSDNKEEILNLEKVSKIQERESIWLILSHAQNTKGLYRAYLNQTYDLGLQTHLKGIDIYCYTK